MFRWIDTTLLYGMGALAETLIVAGFTIPAPIRHWRRRRISVVGVLHGAWMAATLLLWVRWTFPAFLPLLHPIASADLHQRDDGRWIRLFCLGVGIGAGRLAAPGVIESVVSRRWIRWKPRARRLLDIVSLSRGGVPDDRGERFVRGFRDEAGLSRLWVSVVRAAVGWERRVRRLEPLPVGRFVQTLARQIEAADAWLDGVLVADRGGSRGPTRAADELADRVLAYVECVERFVEGGLLGVSANGPAHRMDVLGHAIASLCRAERATGIDEPLMRVLLGIDDALDPKAEQVSPPEASASIRSWLCFTLRLLVPGDGSARVEMRPDALFALQRARDREGLDLVPRAEVIARWAVSRKLLTLGFPRWSLAIAFGESELYQRVRPVGDAAYNDPTDLLPPVNWQAFVAAEALFDSTIAATAGRGEAEPSAEVLAAEDRLLQLAAAARPADVVRAARRARA